MGRIVVCFKWVVNDADIRVRESDRSLDFGRVQKKISEYDRNAIQAAVDLKAATGAEVVGLSVGAGLKPALKDALSRGLDRVCYVDDPTLDGAGARDVARVLAAAIEKIGQVDTVICGEGSSDQYNQQMGSRLAARLGMAGVSCVSAMGKVEGGLKLTRKLDDGLEVVLASGPVVLSVMPDLNEAPIPGLKQILAAQKKPAQEFKLAELGVAIGGGLAPTGLQAPVVDRRRERLNPDGVSLAEAAQALVGKLTSHGILG